MSDSIETLKSLRSARRRIEMADENKPVSVSIELIDAMAEIQLIDLLFKASSQFDHLLSDEEKARAIKYFSDMVLSDK